MRIVVELDRLATGAELLRQALFDQASRTGPFWVTYPSGKSRHTGAFLGDANLWVATDRLKTESGEPSRWWNAFNLGDPYAESAPQLIAVEINIPEGRQGNIQGVLLEDASGSLWLGHRGRLGGNSASFGGEFLDWYPGHTVSVRLGRKDVTVIVVGELSDPDLPFRIGT